MVGETDKENLSAIRKCLKEKLSLQVQMGNFTTNNFNSIRLSTVLYMVSINMKAVDTATHIIFHIYDGMIVFKRKQALQVQESSPYLLVQWARFLSPTNKGNLPIQKLFFKLKYHPTNFSTIKIGKFYNQ